MLMFPPNLIYIYEVKRKLKWKSRRVKLNLMIDCYGVDSMEWVEEDEKRKEGKGKNGFEEKRKWWREEKGKEEKRRGEKRREGKMMKRREEKSRVEKSREGKRREEEIKGRDTNDSIVHLILITYMSCTWWH